MAEQFKYAQALADRVAGDATLQAQVKNDPVATLRQLAAPAQIPDTGVYRIVVSCLGLAVLFALGAAAVLAGMSKTVPEGVIAIGSAACGALAGLLAPSPAQGGS